jgi:serine/threonine protein kinase/WD40 repeat protein
MSTHERNDSADRGAGGGGGSSGGGGPVSLKDVFAKAASMGAEERGAFLDRACAGDAGMRSRVEELLRVHDAAPAFMANPTDAAGAQMLVGGAARSTVHRAIVQGPGSRVGHYKILQHIGEGGFGTVFLAEQERPVRRKVALKIIKPGMDSRQVIGRFEAERQALAIMDHPHIARVLDGGLTDDQRPYFVMEYVVGDAITKFADAHTLTVRERLDLFQQVCSAVQHAHTKGIIHRDLKPGNVLVSMVDGKPFAKVIDFGIAKATGAAGGRLSDVSFFTEHRQLIGTPEYMSPEQAEGSLDIDTRTDVYSLGVLLYELLTGTTPIEGERLRSAAFDEMRRIIREEEPPAPSMRLVRALPSPVSAAEAQASAPVGGAVAQASPPVGAVSPGRNHPKPRAFAKFAEVKGELDWIVLKALEKERGRRYESASALADDVRRHLSGEAVVAAPISTAYRVRKFVKRNRGAVVTASAVAAALLVGIAGTTWQWGVARQAADRERMAKDDAQHQQRAAESARDALAAQVTSIKGVFDSVATEIRHASEAGVFPATEPVTPTDPGQDPTLLQLRLMREYSVHWIREAVASHQALRERTRQAERQSEIAKRAIEEAAKLMYCDVCPGDELAPTKDYADGMRSVRPELSEDEVQIRTLAFMAEKGAEQLQAKTQEAQWSAYTANLALAQAAMEDGDFERAREAIEDCPKANRGWEWSLLRSRAQSVKWSSRRIPLSVDADSGRIVTQAGDFRVTLDDAASGAILADLGRVGNRTQILSSAGVLLAMAHDNIVTKYSLVTGELVQSARMDPGHRLTLFSSDGSRILATTGDGRLLLLAWPKGEVVATLSEPGGYTSSSFLGDGRFAVLSGVDGWQVLDASTGEQRIRVDGGSIAITPNGQFAAVSDTGASITIYETGSWSVKQRLEVAEGRVDYLMYFARPDRLVATLDDGRVLVTDGARSIVIESRLVDGHVPLLSMDGSLIATSDAGGNKTTVWSGESGERLVTVRGAARQFGDGDATLVTIDGDGATWHVWDVATGMRRMSVRSDPLASLNDAQLVGELLLVTSRRIGAIGGRVEAHVVDAMGGPEQVIASDDSLAERVSAIMRDVASLQPAVKEVATPDGTRRISVDSEGRVRFFARGHDQEREVAVFRMDDAVTNLQMTGDGMRLIIHLADGSARVWDIREPEERRKDLQAEWAERAPAGAYLDTFWNAKNADGSLSIPDDKLRDAVIADASLTPLRRLVAVELIGERLDDDGRAAEAAFEAIIKDQTDKALVQSAATAADLPPRVRARVVEKAAGWVAGK